MGSLYQLVDGRIQRGVLFHVFSLGWGLHKVFHLQPGRILAHHLDNTPFQPAVFLQPVDEVAAESVTTDILKFFHFFSIRFNAAKHIELAQFTDDPSLFVQDSPLDFVLLFEKAKGERKLVAWTAPPPKQSPDKAKAHAVKIPTNAKGPLTACELYGKTKELAVAGGKVSVTLTGSPQYVTLPAGAKVGE